MKLAYYPTLSKAFDLMLADNVGSFMTATCISVKVYDQSLEPVGIFDRAEEELSKLSENELDMLCCGAPDEKGCPKVSAEAEEILNALFEMI